MLLQNPEAKSLAGAAQTAGDDKRGVGAREGKEDANRHKQSWKGDPHGGQAPPLAGV